MRTGDLTPVITAGRQICGSLEAASRREWLVTDGLGGYAMGTVSGLRTRRYHGLLVVATEPPIGRRLALASLDPVVVIGDERTRLATHEWADGTLSPAGYRLLSSFTLRNGMPLLALGPGRGGHRARAGHGPRPARGRHRPPRGADAPDGAARAGGVVHLAGRPR